MNPTSVLQQQFPLSPRKFWKKIFSRLIGFFVIAALFGGLTIIPLYAIIFTGPSEANSTNLIVMLVAVVAGLILYFLMILPYAWYIKAYIKRYYYSGEDHFITIKKGVFTPAEIHVQWQKIQDVYVDQDLLDRIMGLYDVHIASATAASGIEAHIDGVDQAAAQGLKEFLLNKVSNAGRNYSQLQTQPIQNQPVVGQTGTSQPQASAIKLSEEISSNVYPLSGTWVAIRLIGCVVSPFLYWAFFIFIIGAKLATDIPSDYYWIYFLGYFAISALSAIVHIIFLFLWKKNYAFNFTPDNIYYRQGTIALSEKHMPYSSIQDVTVQQSFLERIVGLAKVRIENAAQAQMIQTRRGAMPIFAGVMLQGISIADANKITNILKTTVLGRNTSQYGL
jgi:membrane protein YdbS with pleckstrin-like domain